MGFLAVERRDDDKVKWQPQSLKEFGLYMDSLAYGGLGTASGQYVGEEQALKLSAVWACVRRLGEPIAFMPFQVLEEVDKGRERRKGHYLWPVLNLKANRELTAFEWRETMVAHVALWGNHYSWIERDNLGRVRGLWPQHPSRVEIKREPSIGGDLFYYVAMSDGSKRRYRADEILHIKLLSLDGVHGLSFIGCAREGIGIGLSLEELAARFFGHGMQLDGSLKHPKTLTDKAKANLKASLKEQFGGVGRSHGLLILEEGMEYERIGIPPEDSQFLESRRHTINDIARWFLVPAPLINDLSGSTNNNIEEQDRTFITLTLAPGWCRRIEARVNADLFLPSEQATFYAKFNLDALLRGDPKARAESLAIQHDHNAINSDEWRELEDRNPWPNGQGQLNLVPLNKVNAQDVIDGKVQLGQTLKGSPDLARAAILKSARSSIEAEVLRFLKREEADVVNAYRRFRDDRPAFESRLAEIDAEVREYALPSLARTVRNHAAMLGKSILDLDSYLGERVVLQKGGILGCLVEPDQLAALAGFYGTRRLTWPASFAESIIESLES